MIRTMDCDSPHSTIKGMTTRGGDSSVYLMTILGLELGSRKMRKFSMKAFCSE